MIRRSRGGGGGRGNIMCVRDIDGKQAREFELKKRKVFAQIGPNEQG